MVDKRASFLKEKLLCFPYRKKGISAIIATVLIILITLAAVAIVWVTIVPVIKDNVLSVGEEARVSIVVDQGYTIFDTGRQVASVQIKRGTDDAELARLNIVFEINGTSEVFKTKGAPNTNEAKIYWFNFSNYTDLAGKVPQYVSVVPVYLRNNQEVIGDAADRVEIPLRSISLSDDDLTAIFSDDGNTVFRKDEAIPVGEPPVGTGNVIYIDNCTNLSEEDMIYELTENIEGTTRDCFVVQADNVTLDMQGNSVSGVISNQGYCGPEGVCSADNQEDCESTIYSQDGYCTGDSPCEEFLSNQVVCESYSGSECSWELYTSYCFWTDIYDNPSFGVRVSGFNNFKLANGKISNFLNGVSLFSNSYNQISGVAIENTRFGINLESSSYNKLSDINISKGLSPDYTNQYGVSLSYSNHNNLSQISVNDLYQGTLISDSSNNNISGTFLNNQRGFMIGSSSDTQISNSKVCSDGASDFFCSGITTGSGDGNIFDSNSGCGWISPSGSC